MRKSKVKKTISRKISTAQYESIDITVDIEEEIEWETPAERMKKTETVTKILLIDFIQTLEKTMADLGLKKKMSTISNHGKSSQNIKDLKTDESIDIEGNDSFEEDDTFDFIG